MRVELWWIKNCVNIRDTNHVYKILCSGMHWKLVGVKFFASYTTNNFPASKLLFELTSTWNAGKKSPCWPLNWLFRWDNKFQFEISMLWRFSNVQVFINGNERNLWGKLFFVENLKEKNIKIKPENSLKSFTW